ncbi:hypothetical protein [Dyadobacter sp. CY326]|uniref:hypothetical protein n=1 Tax=Dyadobacter sp. CY326 TaxID=2907300 RepID=UPI001F1DFE96|nr:hypothetical protein [Dyadobacter sp. CY326]MCE7067168.1 hypothetical protein [Dyadobacter sp. CY326]
MKKFLLALIMLNVFQLAYAQDSTNVSFSQEVDTLVKQRFIDRYENLFMTKVPTGQMFKKIWGKGRLVIWVSKSLF